MSKTDGGPAFPSVPDRNYDLSSGEVILTMHYGMTLRDYFAAAALPAIIANDDRWPCEIDPITGDDEETEVGLAAAVAYMIADAMLAERDK